MISEWADGGLRWFADKIGVPVSEYSAETVGEYLGTGLEQVTDFFTKGWFKKGILFGTGLLAGLYAIYGDPRDQRLKREMVPISNHLLARIMEVRPEDLAELWQSIGLTQLAMRRGDVNLLWASMLRTPSELGMMVGRPLVAVTPPPKVTADVGRIDVEAPTINRGTYRRS